MRLLTPAAALAPVEQVLAAPASLELLIRVEACGVCRTDLHIRDNELPDLRCPLTPGHEVVGRVEARGDAVTRFGIGQRVGVPWLAFTCGACAYCLAGCENLCERARFT